MGVCHPLAYGEAADTMAQVLTETEKQKVHGYEVRENLLRGTDNGNIWWLRWNK